MTCAECGHEVSALDPERLEEATGWTKDRPRGTGGLHHLRFWTKTGRVMCGRCARSKSQTGNALQGRAL
jgi:hypothetical protein